MECLKSIQASATEDGRGEQKGTEGREEGVQRYGPRAGGLHTQEGVWLGDLKLMRAA